MKEESDKTRTIGHKLEVCTDTLSDEDKYISMYICSPFSGSLFFLRLFVYIQISLTKTQLES